MQPVSRYEVIYTDKHGERKVIHRNFRRLKTAGGACASLAKAGAVKIAVMGFSGPADYEDMTRSWYFDAATQQLKEER